MIRNRERPCAWGPARSGGQRHTDKIGLHRIERVRLGVEGHQLGGLDAALLAAPAQLNQAAFGQAPKGNATCHSGIDDGTGGGAQAQIFIEGALAHLSSSTGIDLSCYGLDEPIRYERNNANNSAVEAITVQSKEPWTLRRLIGQNASEDEIAEVGIEVALRDEARRYVLEGLTTVEEALRITGAGARDGEL